MRRRSANCSLPISPGATGRKKSWPKPPTTFRTLGWSPISTLLPSGRETGSVLERVPYHSPRQRARSPMTASVSSTLIPVTLLTGFLGSGKTTVLNHVLKQPEMAATAVIVNEFGEIGLDHLLVEQSSEDVVLLNSGCLCCTVRNDIVDTLTSLFVDRAKRKIPFFTRVAIETTGLADPAPILHTLMTEPIVSARYMLDGVVTTVDVVNGAATLDRQTE